jgi:hypothetical protein
MLSGSYYWITRSEREALVFFAAVAAAAGAVLTAVYAARAINLQTSQQITASAALADARLHSRRLEAMRYAARWNEPRMEQARKACREILQMDGRGVHDITEALTVEDRELRVVHMLNFLEEVAVAIERDVADPEVLRDVYRDAVVLVWRCMDQWAIKYRVGRGQPSAWVHLEALYKAWS